MPLADDQVAELMMLWPRATRQEEAGKDCFLIPQLPLPEGHTPAAVDALLWPHERDGYPSRLYFSQVVSSPTQRNWNHTNVSILGRNWHAYSWKVDPAIYRLAQIVRSFIGGLS
jgi:hypothetical protein